MALAISKVSSCSNAASRAEKSSPVATRRNIQEKQPIKFKLYKSTKNIEGGGKNVQKNKTAEEKKCAGRSKNRGKKRQTKKSEE
jgi:hypothetical protein